MMRLMTPLRPGKTALLLTLLSLMIALVPPQSAVAQMTGGTIKTTIGDWQISCGRPAGSKIEKCAAVQSVTAEDRPNVGLTVIFQKSLSKNKLMLLVVAPLGVLLPTGLGLIIDGKDVGRVPFLRCGKIGCFAEAVVPQVLAKKFKNGKTALFTIFQTPEEGIAIPIALNGFTKALSNIK
jgi:invasion protein IalB